MNASLKKIIWAIGWYLTWAIDNYLLYLENGKVGRTSYQLVMLMIWIIPLIFLKDDERVRK